MTINVSFRDYQSKFNRDIIFNYTVINLRHIIVFVKGFTPEKVTPIIEIISERSKIYMEFRQFLEEKYLDWQKQTGGRKTVLEFANYLGVHQSTVSTWWNGDRIPQGENIVKLSLKLGLEVYDVLGLQRPDADLYYIQQNWEQFTPEERHWLRETAEKYATSNEPRKITKRARAT